VPHSPPVRPTPRAPSPPQISPTSPPQHPLQAPSTMHPSPLVAAAVVVVKCLRLQLESSTDISRPGHLRYPPLREVLVTHTSHRRVISIPHPFNATTCRGEMSGCDFTWWITASILLKICTPITYSPPFFSRSSGACDDSFARAQSCEFTGGVMGSGWLGL
jgi:hypothetical protein